MTNLHEHTPKWGGGPCRKCDRLWPCFERQLASMKEFHGYPDELFRYMNDWLSGAYRDLAARGLTPDDELEKRYLGWIWVVAEKGAK